jgi:UDP-glucose 4-epimerase
VVPSFVECALAGRPLVIYDDGCQSRCFTGIKDFISALSRVIANPKAWLLPNRALNIGSSSPTKILDLANMVIGRTNSMSHITHVPYGSVFPGRYDLRARRPDITLLDSLIGPTNWQSIESIVDDIIAEYRG